MNTKEIDYETDFGNVKIKLNVLMDKKHISISTMSKLANVKYEIVKKYYYGDIMLLLQKYFGKICYILDCKIDDILVYETSKDYVNQG